MKNLSRITLYTLLTICIYVCSTLSCTAQIGAVLQASNYPLIDVRGELVTYTSEKIEYGERSVFHAGVEYSGTLGFSRTDGNSIALPVSIGAAFTAGVPRLRGLLGFGFEGSLIRQQANMIDFYNRTIPMSQWFPFVQSGVVYFIDNAPVQLRCTVSGLLVSGDIVIRGGIGVYYIFRN